MSLTMQRLHPILFCGLLLLSACARQPDRNTLVMIIESTPANLDPRIGTDAPSERIDMLIFDSLVRRDEHFNLQPSVAVRWEIPDPLTYIFHLRSGVRFHDGRLLTSRDVKWTVDSMLTGTVVSARAGTYKDHLVSVDPPNDSTVIFHLKDSFAGLLWNLADGAFGIVPYGSAVGFNQHPIGSGPFRFVSLQQDNEIILERNADYWDAQRRPHIERVRLAIVPDATTRALELRKGSADIVLTALTPDMVWSMRKDRSLEIEQAPGTIYAYLGFSFRDPLLKDTRVRQAIAYAIDRQPLIEHLWRGEARLAYSILPPQSWAYSDSGMHYDHDVSRARQLLDAAGFRPGPDGMRMHLVMKTSTEESTRLLAATLQQQLRAVGIALDIRTLESATFYSDVTKGAFQLYSLRWIGGNQDPDIFEAVFASSSFPPRRYNRGYYSNPQVDALIAEAASELDQSKRAQIYAQIQQILARDLPYINLWYLDNVLVHTRRVRNLHLSPSGDYDFLTSATLAQ